MFGDFEKEGKYKQINFGKGTIRLAIGRAPNKKPA
jgi:hypothetical protein